MAERGIRVEADLDVRFHHRFDVFTRGIPERLEPPCEVWMPRVEEDYPMPFLLPRKINLVIDLRAFSIDDVGAEEARR
jgi:hypothetical protein